MDQFMGPSPAPNTGWEWKHKDMLLTLCLQPLPWHPRVATGDGGSLILDSGTYSNVMTAT